MTRDFTAVAHWLTRVLARQLHYLHKLNNPSTITLYISLILPRAISFNNMPLLLRGFRISFDGPRKSEEWSFKADPFCGAHGDLVLLHKTMFREIPLYGKTWAMAKPRKQGVKTYRPWFIADPRQLSPKFELAPIPSIKPLPQIRLRVRAHSTQ